MKMTKEQKKRFEEIKAYLHLTDIYGQPLEDKLEEYENLAKKNIDLMPFIIEETKKIARSELKKCQSCSKYEECMKDEETKAYKLEKNFSLIAN